jgi:DnaJ-class molecular chaperone
MTLYPGGSKPKTCPDCNGTGKKRWKHRESSHHSSGSETECPTCGGRGFVGPM